MTMYYIRKEEEGVYAVSTTDISSFVSGDWPDDEYFEYAMAALVSYLSSQPESEGYILVDKAKSEPEH
ncbi:TPA: hypothetical protein MD350_001528 [Klebsiella pneumoniae]|uniref:hypothetical protein n=1 Tax=Klebsiella TaxID=570 RepID=UPI000D5A1DFB|nr:hypothetical protein [Klebsiella pneumoniae]HBX3748107.1 hypothetical protein [Klebsiella pneumoniae subsp. pneumoniae]HCB0534399.1 hypothetical protein [Klebsiella variicola subsp. variicola]HCM7831858.1 hypothetical protein [Klebsiella quasipneumoniae subsp. quasipneumoniae]HCT6258897.1 hypothetical protein [Klebsiella quasipneumoniae]EKV3967188.1 hypothetical protein [Klebsiella pneumoniae]